TGVQTCALPIWKRLDTVAEPLDRALVPVLQRRLELVRLAGIPVDLGEEEVLLELRNFPSRELGEFRRQVLRVETAAGDDVHRVLVVLALECQQEEELIADDRAGDGEAVLLLLGGDFLALDLLERRLRPQVLVGEIVENAAAELVRAA